MDQKQTKSTTTPTAPPPVAIMREPQQESSGSIATRVRASASGLVRQTILNPSAGFMTGALASSTADAGKGGSGSSSAGPSQSTVSSLSPNVQDSSVHSPADSRNESTEWVSFRLHPGYRKNDGYIDQYDFGDFMSRSSGPGLAKPSNWSDRGDDSASANEKFVLQSRPSKANIQLSSAPQRDIHGHPVKKTLGLNNDNDDGAAVVSLLSGPDFSVDEDSADFWGFETENLATCDDKNLEMEALAAAPLDQVSAVNPLDLLPDFRRPQNNATTTRLASLTATTSDFPESYVYDKTQVQLHGGDLQPWLDMLNKYQDEVWGYMLPLVQEAREEAKASKERIPEDQPATRRLRMLLKHLE